MMPQGFSPVVPPAPSEPKFRPRAGFLDTFEGLGQLNKWIQDNFTGRIQSLDELREEGNVPKGVAMNAARGAARIGPIIAGGLAGGPVGALIGGIPFGLEMIEAFNKEPVETAKDFLLYAPKTLMHLNTITHPLVQQDPERFKDKIEAAKQHFAADPLSPLLTAGLIRGGVKAGFKAADVRAPIIRPVSPEVPKPPTTPTVVAETPVAPKPLKPYAFESVEIEARFKAAGGVKKETLPNRIRASLEVAKNKAQREFEHLPHTEEFSQLRFDLLRLRKQKGVSGDKAVRRISALTEPLNSIEYDLFRRKVILDDLAAVAGEGQQLPFGFTPRSVRIELARLDNALPSSVKTQIEARSQSWGELRTDYTKAMQEIGLNVEGRLTRENYYRHQVLEYARAKSITGTGKKVKTPAARGFLKKRRGSEFDINTDYVQAEYEVMSQMLHDIEVAKVIKAVDVRDNIAPKLKKQAKIEGIEDWHDLMPEGHRVWQPREGNAFYLTETIPHALAEQIATGALTELGIPKKILGVGRKRREFVLKNEIAETLDNFSRPRSDSIISNASRKLTRSWKVWTLISPRRFTKYNIRNLTGDAEAAFLGNPAGFRKAPRAAREIFEVIARGKEMTPEFRGWFERGGMESTLQALELGELSKLDRFSRLAERKISAGDLPTEVWREYWRKARITTDMREAILRYANYLDYLEQIKTSGKPKNLGASIPEEIAGLANSRDQAYALSNDLLGAYDKIGVVGQNLREHIIPFWSWKEVNFKRYLQLYRNAVNDGRTAQVVGRKLLGSAAKSPFIAYRVGKFAIKATAFWSALQVWNHTQFPEEEASLTEQERSTPHIILGVDEDGKIITFNRMGTLGDFLEWFGLDAAPAHISDWMEGKKTIKEIGLEMAKSPVNVIGQGLTPIIKLPAELATRQALFPDVFRPRTIRDRGFHVARSLGLGNEYKAALRLPSRPYEESVSGAFIYKTDPLQAAYGNTANEKARFLKRKGKGSVGFWITPRGDALYNTKLAIRYRDEKAAAKYFIEYVRLGGTEKGFTSSMERLMPLSGLTKEEQVEFVLALSNEDRKNLTKAIRFWQESLLGTGDEEFYIKMLKELNIEPPPPEGFSPVRSQQ